MNQPEEKIQKNPRHAELSTSLWSYVIFPSAAMLLGWGLRGYIGGGPFGAMIPGAFVAMSLALLLRLPVKSASILTLFSAVGIGLGGEMTYGQTLGLLKNGDTLWWGLLGTTLKGSVWGVTGGIVLSLGLVYRNLSRKTIVTTFLLLLAGMVAGFKLVNQPMLVYFSDPAQPRPESWAAFLTGSLLMLYYIRKRVSPAGFRIISRMALGGLIGGGAGFGLGSLWMVAGFQLPGVIFDSWWKAMEFTFGMLLGAGLGVACWSCYRNSCPAMSDPPEKPSSQPGNAPAELAITFLAALVVFWLIPHSLDPYVDRNYRQGLFLMPGAVDLAKLLSNFAVYGFLMILLTMGYPSVAWQFGITLTFSHTVIDFLRDIYPEAPGSSPFTLYFLLIFLSALLVGLCTARLQRKDHPVRNLFLLLIWSCMGIAFLRLGFFENPGQVKGLTLCGLVCGKFFVHLIFLVSAVYISWYSIKRTNDGRALQVFPE
jgi:hypothetical protein